MAARTHTLLTNIGRSLGEQGTALLSAIREAGFRVVSASRAKQGLELASEIDPDIVLLNPSKPRMDGYSFCQRLKQDQQLAAIPVIFITDRAGKQAITTGFEAGCVDFITRPYSSDEVIARLTTHLKLHEGRAVGGPLELGEVLDALPAHLLVVDSSGRIHAVQSPQVVANGSPLSQLRPRSRVGEVFPEHPAKVLTDLIHQAREGGRTVSASCGLRGDDAAWLELFVVRHGPDRFLVLVRDITEQHRIAEEKAQLEDALRQEEKMESIGRLAVGISHDMNNILGVVMSLSSNLRVDLEPASGKQEDIDHIIGACRRGYELTSKLACLASRVDYLKEPLSLNGIIEEALELLERAIPGRVQIRTQLDPSNPRVIGDPVLINHVVVNLALNAADAIPDAGTVTFTTWTETLGPRALAAHPELRPGPHAVLEVTDTGIGMSPRVRARAFEPFFTTKPKDKGFGLGLPMIYGIVKNHGGRVDLASQLNQGTRVTIYLPAEELEVRAAEADGEAEAQATPHPGLNTIMVVDDEDMVLYSLRRLLQRMGYAVITADGGVAALEAYRQHHDKISIVLLDLIMPGMDGVDVFHRLKEIDPKVNVLLCTGYRDEKLIDKLRDEGVLGVVRKPFDLDQLTGELDQIFS